MEKQHYEQQKQRVRELSYQEIRELLYEATRRNDDLDNILDQLIRAIFPTLTPVGGKKVGYEEIKHYLTVPNETHAIILTEIVNECPIFAQKLTMWRLVNFYLFRWSQEFCIIKDSSRMILVKPPR